MWQHLALVYCFSFLQTLSKLLFSCGWKRTVEHSQPIAVAQKLAALNDLCKLSAAKYSYPRWMLFGLDRCRQCLVPFLESRLFWDSLLRFENSLSPSILEFTPSLSLHHAAFQPCWQTDVTHQPVQHFSADPAVLHIWLWSVADILSELDRCCLSACS